MSKKQKNKKDDKSTPHSPRINNKKARFNFHILEKLEAGMVLVGTEVKSLRQGKASLDEAFCRIRNGELYLIGCNIAKYDHGNISNHEPVTPRKLLVHRRELHKIEVKLNQKGLTLVPLRIFFNSRGFAKIEVALCQGKTFADKRQKLKTDQTNRDMKRAMSKWQ